MGVNMGVQSGARVRNRRVVVSAVKNTVTNIDRRHNTKNYNYKKI